MGLIYGAVPKAACTTIKYALYQEEYGHPFSPEKAGVKYAHNIFPTLPFSKYSNQLQTGEFHSITIVREPVERFLSGYSNRVLYHRELRPEFACGWTNPELKPDPDLDEFIDLFERYFEGHQSINHHFAPAVHYLGKEASVWSRIYSMSSLGRLQSDLRELLNNPAFKLGHRQKGGPKLDERELTKKQLEKIESFYADDYRVFANYY